MSSPSHSLYYTSTRETLAEVRQEIENKLVLIIHATFFSLFLYKCVGR